MSFDPCNCPLKIQEFIRTPTPKMGAHLEVCGFIPSLSHTPGSMKCDSHFIIGPHLRKPLLWS
jgi:hypothetical protein